MKAIKASSKNQILTLVGNSLFLLGSTFKFPW